MKDIKHFIWDFDGTLLDTYKYINAYLVRAVQDFGFSAEKKDVMRLMMQNFSVAIGYYTEKYSEPGIEKRFYEYHKNLSFEPVEPFPYVKEVLEKIVESGRKNHVFTHRNSSVYPMLERAGLLPYFSKVITSESPYFERKPSPRAINFILEAEKAEPQSAAMVGDRECDLGSGIAAGTKTIHLLTAGALEYPACDYRISSFLEMLEMLG